MKKKRIDYSAVENAGHGIISGDEPEEINTDQVPSFIRETGQIGNAITNGLVEPELMGTVGTTPHVDLLDCEPEDEDSALEIRAADAIVLQTGDDPYIMKHLTPEDAVAEGCVVEYLEHRLSNLGSQPHLLTRDQLSNLCTPLLESLYPADQVKPKLAKIKEHSVHRGLPLVHYNEAKAVSYLIRVVEAAE